MYIHRVTRTQLYLDDDIHRRLTRLAKLRGRTLSDLVREALRRIYGGAQPKEQLQTLRDIEGLWRGRSDLEGTEAYVRRLRSDTRRSRLRRR